MKATSIVLVLCLSLLSVGLVLAQTEKESLSITLASDQFDLVPLGRKGFLILDVQKTKSMPITGLKVQLYDTLLHPQWLVNVALLPKSTPALTKVYDGNYYLITADRSYRQFEVFKIDLNQGMVQQTRHQFSSPFSINDLVAHDQQVWLSGTMLNQGALFSLELTEKAPPKIMPVGFSQPVLAIDQLHFDLATGTINYFLYTNLDKLKTYVFRQTDLKGKVLADVVIQPESKHHLSQLKSAITDKGAFLVGTYFKQQADQPLGIFTSTVDQGKLLSIKLMPFKEITAPNVDFKDLEGAAPSSSFSKKDWGPTVIDTWELGADGLLLSLELLSKDYQVKGTMQQEFEKQERIALIDQNTYGRRELDGAAAVEGATSLDDRVSRLSATDIMQYRYMDAIVGQAQFKGYTYDRTIIMTFDLSLTPKITQSVKMGNHRLYFGQKNNVKWQNDNIALAYQQGEAYHTAIYNPGTEAFSHSNDYTAGQSKMVLPWYINQYLEVVQLPGQKRLELRSMAIE